MKNINILLVDNDVDFLAICSEYLESSGYAVLTASSPAEARTIIENCTVHLAILDLRLTDDADEWDKSGLTLARGINRSIPKIILTKFAAYQDVREALRLDNAALPPAVDFLNKSEGLEKLAEAVEQALDQHVRINWNLVIQHNENNLNFIQLANLVGLLPHGKQLLNRSEELEDLFRRIFYASEQIRIDRLLWQLDDRVAVAVSAFAAERAPESFLVVLGKNTTIMEEVSRYQTFAPKIPGKAGAILSMSCQTHHFAANAYLLVDGDLENAHPLSDTYRSGPERLFNATLKALFEQTLKAWHEDKYILDDKNTLGDIYRKLLGLNNLKASRGSVEESIQSLVLQASRLGIKIERSSGTIVLKYDRQYFRYPDPISFLDQAAETGQQVLLMNSPGTLSGENILADTRGRCWVTDFANAGFSPMLWNYVALESVIRFDWTETSQIRWLHAMEQYLVANDFNKLYTSDIEAPLRKPVRAIQVIRRATSQAMSRDSVSYQSGLLFQAVSRLVFFDPSYQLTPRALARRTHLLLAAAMICDRLSQQGKEVAPKNHASVTGVWIDKSNKEVWVDGIRVTLRGNSYGLLCSLYDQPNKLCTRRELIEQVFGEKYEENNDSQMSRLNTAIHRLRKQLEDITGNKHYLITEQGEGYRLIHKSIE
jgi:DNA-binding response OmpR family regulator